MVAGSSFSAQNFRFSFADEAQLGDFLSMRISVTIAKFMFAVAQLYAEGTPSFPLSVLGAKLQDGTGSSRTIKGADGRSYLCGIEAAHFGIGTVTRCGEALSWNAARQVEVWRKTSGFDRKDVHAFEANGQLAAYGLAHDASTYYAPAFLNRSEGKLEEALQPEMTPFLPQLVPNNPAKLTLALNAIGEGIVAFLVGSTAAALRPLNERLELLNQRGSGAREFLQDPSDVKNLLFKGSEREYLEKLRHFIRGGNEEFNTRVARLMMDIPLRSSELAGIAQTARQERVAAQASSTGA